MKFYMTSNHDMKLPPDSGIERRVLQYRTAKQFLPTDEYEESMKKISKVAKDEDILTLFDDEEYQLAFIHLI